MMHEVDVEIAISILQKQVPAPIFFRISICIVCKTLDDAIVVSKIGESTFLVIESFLAGPFEALQCESVPLRGVSKRELDAAHDVCRVRRS